MRKILLAGVLFAGAVSAKAYELVAKVSLEDDTRLRFDIELANNDMAFTAFQLDITLDGEATLRRENMNSGELMHNHSLVLNSPKGHYCVLGYSMGKSCLKGAEGPLFSFTLDGDTSGLVIDDIVFVKTDGTREEPAEPVKTADGKEETAARPATNKVFFNMEGQQTFRIDSRGICIRCEKNAQE